MIQRKIVMGGFLEDHGYSFEEQHGEEGQARDHRPLHDPQPVRAPPDFSGADVHREAQRAGDEKEKDQPAENQHLAPGRPKPDTPPRGGRAEGTLGVDILAPGRPKPDTPPRGAWAEGTLGVDIYQAGARSARPAGARDASSKVTMS